MANRIKEFREEMKCAQIDFALIHKPENMRYVAGYTGEGCVLIGRENAAILTNFIYIEQAQRQTDGLRVVQVGGEVKLTEALALLMADGAAGVAVETDCLTVDRFRELKRGLPMAQLRSLDGLPERMRAIKDADELALIRRACDIACRAFDRLLGWLKPGMTEKRVQIELSRLMQDMGSERDAFDIIVASGPNGSLPHAVAGERVIEAGDLITFDFGAQVEGYKSDMTRTVGVGAVSSELKKIYQTVLDAQLRALEAIRVGVRASDVDAVARAALEGAYPGRFGHGLGHGVGLMVHEQPGVNTRDNRLLAAGHVITIEPGIYIPGLGGCRIEDMGVVTEGGFDNMITAPKELIEI